MAFLGGATRRLHMIPVAVRPEPTMFAAMVRGPGLAFLAGTPNPTTRQWSSRSYWTRCLGELRDAYQGICAYSCHWIPNTDGRSVEHFRPKRLHPALAYEWANYRLVFGVLNGCKGDYEDVLDPFAVQAGWFVIEFPTLLVKPGTALDPVTIAAVLRTCERLKLNDEDKCLKDRLHWLRAYCEGQINWAFLQRMAPFLAAELTRQGLQHTIAGMMNF